MKARMIVFAVLIGMAAAALQAQTEKRGPSTPEERKQALAYIHDYVDNPLGPNAVKEREWVLYWVIEVPDVHVSLCMVLDQLPKGNKKDASEIFAAQTLGQTEYAIMNIDKPADAQAETTAGVEAALKVYEKLVKAKPKDQQAYLDDLLKRRDAGTLGDYVKAQLAAHCSSMK